MFELVKLGGLPLAVLTPGATLYAQADQLGTVRVLRDATGTTVWRWESDPFGAALPEEDPDGDSIATHFPLRFPGQYHDAETGLHYNYYRDYDPLIGRYIQSDPIGLLGGVNTYLYSSGNPVRRIDPTGLVDWSGSQTTVAAGEIGGAVRFKFKLESDCVDGKKGKAEVVAGGFALSLGMPASATYSRSVQFTDDNTGVDPTVFHGGAMYAYASWAMTWPGASYQAIQLGGARTVGGGRQMGWDATVAAGAGISTVVMYSIEECGCKKR